MHRLSIIIVNFNAKEILLECLRRVKRASEGIDVEFFVVDNGSTDGSKEAVESAFTNVKYIYCKENIGFAKANNIAIRQSNSKYILLLNPDLFVSDDTIKSVLSQADTLERFGALGVRMVNGDGEFLPESKRNRPTLWNSFCKITRLGGLFPNSSVFASYYNVKLGESEMGRTDVLCGAFMLINSAELKEKAILPECYFMFGEDVDLSISILESGYYNYYLPITVTHLKGKCSNHHSKEYYEAFYGSMSIYYDRHSNCKFSKFLVKKAVSFIIKIKSRNL